MWWEKEPRDAILPLGEPEGRKAYFISAIQMSPSVPVSV